MKNGYYVSYGLRSVKEDISRMCREAIKYGFLLLCLPVTLKIFFLTNYG